jgi:hypothetical protein
MERSADTGLTWKEKIIWVKKAKLTKAKGKTVRNQS